MPDKSRFKYILFDFDGTVTESAPGITRSVQNALRSVGIIEPDLKKLERFVGPPLSWSFNAYYGLSEEEVRHCIDVFHERYDTIGLFENALYPGVAGMLKELSGRGCYLAVASSKPQRFIDRLTEHFGIAEYFSLKAGAKSELMPSKDPKRTDKDEIIAGVLEDIIKDREISDPESFRNMTAMVGDRMFDMEGAIHNGITPVGVSYGYGSREELIQSGAVFVADSAEQLTEFFS